MIQKQARLDVYDIDGNAVGKKKFVKRSNVKNEIIAALIHFECNKRGIPRKPKDIAQFMQLHTDGFSIGEDTIRKLIADGIISLEIAEETYEGFAIRYLEALGVSGEYAKFIADLIELADNAKVGRRSLPPSKVSGVVWLLNVHAKLGLKTANIEMMCDNTKKNTFIKFYNAIIENKTLFLPLFQRYRIPIV